jgi:hypothetical protein
VFGDGKTSLRGGYGIGYERNFGNVTFNVIQNPPNYGVVALLAGPNGDVPSIPVTLNNAGPLAGSGGTKVLPIVSLRWVRPDIVTAYSHFYSFGFQRELTSRTIVGVEYTGSTGKKLYSLENYNRTGFGPQYLNSNATRPAAIGGTVSRLNGQYGNINARANGGRSQFNAMIVSVDSNNFRDSGLGITAKYRYSVARDNLSSTFSQSTNNFNLGLLDPFNPDLDYGYADFDNRHTFTTGFNWEVPFGKGTKGALRQLVDGWSFNGIVTANTGSPFSVFDCTNGITVCLRLVPTDRCKPNRAIWLTLATRTVSS